MSNIRICLAIGRANIEEWIMKQTKERKMAVEYTQPAPYRDLVLERVSTEMPQILVLARDLRKGKDSLSFDAIVRKIRMNYKSCRIILLAGDLKPGDEFLNRMVSRGVYDILVGEKIQMFDLLDCIEHPKDYAYAESLQGLEPVSVAEDSGDIEISTPPVQEEPRAVYTPAPAPVPSYNKVIEPEIPEEVFEEVSETVPESSGGTSVLSSPVPQIIAPAPKKAPEPQVKREPRGIIFEKIADSPRASAPIPEPKPQPQPSYNSYNSYDSYNTSPPARRVTQSSHPVTNNNVLTAEDHMQVGGPKPLSTGYMPRITCFVGARQGVGCTTAVINTAYMLAMSGKRVVVIDAVWNEKCIFDRLGFRHESTGFNNRGGELPTGFVGSKYVTVSDKAGKIIGAIQFLELKTGKYPENSNVITTISKLSGYDHVLIDMSVGFYHNVLVGIAGLADRIVAVTIQDNYELMVLRNYLNVYQTKTQIFNKLILIINRGNPRLSPTIGDTANYIITSDIIMIPSDTDGFTRANNEKRHYIGKKKITSAYNFLITKL